jgi:hypothetical protein
MLCEVSVDEVSISGRTNQNIALDLQQKIELYFLALIFTVAGLAIQSAKFSGNVWQWRLEVAGWACLVAAGIVALLRMQHVPRIFYYAHEAWSADHQLEAAKREPVHSTIPFEDGPLAQPAAIAKLQFNIAFYKKTYERIRARLRFIGKIQTCLFVAGIILVAWARASAGYFATCSASVG